MGKVFKYRYNEVFEAVYSNGTVQIFKKGKLIDREIEEDFRTEKEFKKYAETYFQSYRFEKKMGSI